MAHELGHNLSLGHAPCIANTGLDPAYPYADASTGSWGYDAGRILDPDTAHDLMAYCYPPWISDYNFKKLVDYRNSKTGNSIKEEPSFASKLSGNTLLLWGGTDAASRPFLDPIFMLEGVPKLPEAPGPWRLVGYGRNGNELFHLTFAMPIVADGDGGSSFLFAVSIEREQAQSLESVTLSGPGGSFTIDEEYDDSMAIVIDRVSGQITAFLDDYDPSDNSILSAISNKAGGTAQRVLFSRGLPDLSAQN